MNIKPQDFFIGVIDFFSVILPGALVTYFLKGRLYLKVFGADKVFPLPATDVQKWIAFLLATYIIGHLIFIVAAFLLDKVVYDKFLRNIFFRKNFDLSYHTAAAIRDQYLPSESWIGQIIRAKKLKEKEIKELLKKDGQEIVNTFKWAQNYLAVKFPETLVDIRKLEADSKFFRSLVVAFIIIGAVLSRKGESQNGGYFFVLSLLSLFRYGNLRYKSTQKAYELIITINHLEKGSTSALGMQTQDNRIIYLMSEKEIVPYQERISELTKGLRVTSEVFAIPMGKTWKVLNSSEFETLYCMSGKCVAKLETSNDGEEKVILVSNAIMPLPSKSSFEITNKQREPLLLLSIK